MVNIDDDRKKLEKYILKFTNDVVTSTKSAYYRFPGYIIRVSDHIGTNSSGTFSIIPVGNNNFIVHKHANGSIRLFKYEQIKDFIRHVYEYSDMMTIQQQSNWELAKNEAVVQNGEVNSDYVLGVSKKYFSNGQLNAVEQIVSQVKQKNGI